MNVVQRLRELASTIEKEERLPTFAPDEIDIDGAMSVMRQHVKNYDLDLCLKVRENQEPEFRASIHLCRDDKYHSLEGTCFTSPQLSAAVNEAIAHRRSESSQDAPPEVNAVQEMNRVLEPMVDRPF